MFKKAEIISIDERIISMAGEATYTCGVDNC